MLAGLLEDGYGGLTTRRVAERAKVSAASLRVYFPSRAAFVAAAVEELAVELLRQGREHPKRSAPETERFQAWLDELWAICTGPAFSAMMELSCVARTDPNACESFETADRALTRQIAASMTDLFPDKVDDPRFRAIAELATASMRGLAMFAPVTDGDVLDRRWRAIRDELMRLNESLTVDRPISGRPEERT
jgi:AcrR family transcriptional regulator